MAAFNQITLIGRLGRDPEFQFTPGGTAIARCAIAVDDFISKEKKETYWFNLVFFGNLAEIVEKYLTKGSCILVSGKMTIRKYTDKEKNTRDWYEVNCNTMQMLDTKKSEQGQTRAPVDSDFLDEFLGF